MVSDAHMAAFLRRTLRSSRVPEHLKDAGSWPEPMRREWGNDEGASAAPEHRRRMVSAFREVRAAIDSFAPDFIVIWGDDQYENFREDGVPPFCVYIVDRAEYRPLYGIERWAGTDQNIWGESPDKVFSVPGHPSGAKHLARRLLEESFDISYAYALRFANGLAHSFSQTLVYLDYERRGFGHPVVPFHVNCYGSAVIQSRGGGAHLEDERDSEINPPAPTPRRCFELGGAVARVLRDSPWRVVLMASSSWSHAFLTEKNYWLYPDMEADRKRLAELTAGNYPAWRDLKLSEIEAAGEHEILNWVCLAGAMAELGRKAEIVDYIESYVFNSNKCFALFRS
jgi:hypothetical protein